MSGNRILAVGAAGRFAGLVVPELVRRGAAVRGLVRTAENADAARRNGAAEVAVGDLADIDSLRPALEGIDGVFYISPVFAPGETRLGLNLVEAAKATGVRRIVFSSVVHPVLSTLANHAAKAPVEEAIIASGLEFSILHPLLFFQNYAAAWPQVARTGVFAEPYLADKPVSRVDYRDVAEVAAIGLTEDRLLYGTFELAAEGHPDRHGVAAIMGEVLGRQVSAETAPFDTWADKTGLPAEGPVRAGLKTMYGWYDAHGFVGNALTLRMILGRQARTLKTYFEELASSTRS